MEVENEIVAISNIKDEERWIKKILLLELKFYNFLQHDSP